MAVAGNSDSVDQDDEVVALRSIFSSDDRGVGRAELTGSAVFSAVRAATSCRWNGCLEVSPSAADRADDDDDPGEDGGGTTGVLVGDGVRVEFVAPVRLYFELPPDYPSCSPPSYALACEWMTKNQLGTLTAKLDEVWEAAKGSPVLFQWSMVLGDSLSLLGLGNHLFADRVSDGDAPDEDVLAGLLRYDDRRRRSLFDKRHHECDICGESKTGDMCASFTPCRHVFCLECLDGFFRARIGDNLCRGIQCPTLECGSSATPALIKLAVGDELFAKYDHSLLSSTLDQMPDICYCPRRSCQTAVLLDEGRNKRQLAQCANCFFAFCPRCKRSYHGIEPCELMHEEKVALWKAYEDGTDELRKDMARKYGHKLFQRIEEEIATERLFAFTTEMRPCPRCGARIEKDGGCQKMECARCLTPFCWICGQALSRVFVEPGEKSSWKTCDFRSS